MKKILKERYLWVQVLEKKEWEKAGFWTNLPQYLPNPENKFQVYLSYFKLEKETQTISLKVFEIMAFKNWQQETTKGILRS